MLLFGSVRFQIIVLCLIVICLLYNIIPTWIQQSKIEFPIAVLKRLPFEIYHSNSTSSFEKCYFPKVSLPPEDLTLLFRKSFPLSCEQKQLDWAVCEKSVCYVKKDVLVKENDVKCIFIELLFNKGLEAYDGPFMKDVVRYNIVEDAGEFSLLYPLLTGKNKDELRSLGNSMDDYPFIWKTFKKVGYITAHLDDFTLWASPNDVPNFQSVPTDHYIQQYYINARGRMQFWPQFCSGTVPRHKILLDYIRDFFTVYKSRRKFLFSFYGEITHSNFNGLDVIDEDLFALLVFLDKLNILRKTMLIITSDKGYKFSSIKDVLHMKQEEMSPFLYIQLPSMFSKKYPNHYMNFKKNIKGLVTPYDLHYTLRNILLPTVYDETERANSLFQYVPYERSCVSAEIGTGLCACWIGKLIPEIHPLASLLRHILESTLNDISQPLRDKCEELTVMSITNLTRMVPNFDLSRYTKDNDHYIISALVLPGYTIFEAHVLYDKKSNKYLINAEEIISYDYGLHGLCVKNNTKLRKFCYCKDQHY